MSMDKIKTLHEQMPEILNTENNPIWSALIESLGSSDKNIAELIENVRKQFFIKTATRPYLDRLGTRDKVQRPRFVGMKDPDFREFIPIMSYHPKQVKIVFDKLLDLFFMKDATTSFIQSTDYQPFVLEDTWTLEYIVDSYQQERIEFRTDEFTDITAATADEIVAAINRQSRYSYAIAYHDSLTKHTNIRLFTNTIGSKGSIKITGGLANIGLRFEGFIETAGSGANTQWAVTKIGDTVTYTYAGGDSPNLTFVEAGNLVLNNMTGNLGSFEITQVNLSDNSFSFENKFATTGNFTQTSDDDLRFTEAFISYIWQQSRRALTWEVSPGEIVVEIPPSPPIVKRERRGAAHINGIFIDMTTRDGDTSLTVSDITDFPTAGKFSLIEQHKISTEMDDTEIKNYNFYSRLVSDQTIYIYSGISGSQLTGITPNLPTLAALNKVTVVSATRATHELTVITSTAHNFAVNEYAILNNTVSGLTVLADGTFKITEIIDPTTFKCISPGDDGGATGGDARVEKLGLSEDDTKVLLRTSILKPNQPGPYMWDEQAPYVLSSLTTQLTTAIQAGTTARGIAVQANDIPNEEGQLIFSFGTEQEEGPIRYFFKPSDTSISIDPAYIFQYNHSIGSAVTMIRRRGGIQFGGLGAERAPYITDPAVAREVLNELMEEIKSVGVFLRFLIRYPEQYYATLDVYRSGVDPDDTYYDATH